MKQFLIKSINASKYSLIRFEEPVGGSRPRMLLKHSSTNQKHFFKSYSHNSREVWAEFFASKLGESLGFKVQQVNIREVDGTLKEEFLKKQTVGQDWEPIGTLIRYAFPREYNITYGKNVVQAEGTHLSLEGIEGSVRRRYYAPEDILTGFAEMVIFDALIGNMDRHHENWGVLEHSSMMNQLTIDPGDAKHHRQFATLFDHGSSLLFELSEAQVARYLNDLNLFKSSYILGKSYTFFVGLDGRPCNIFKTLSDYASSSADWKKRFKKAIRKLVPKTEFDFAKIILKMPHSPRIDYSEDRQKLLLYSLRVRREALLELS